MNYVINSNGVNMSTRILRTADNRRTDLLRRLAEKCNAAKQILLVLSYTRATEQT